MLQNGIIFATSAVDALREVAKADKFLPFNQVLIIHFSDYCICSKLQCNLVFIILFNTQIHLKTIYNIFLIFKK